MVSREALRSTAPTSETEAKSPPQEGDPTFFRPVPPFNWHKKWSGTSWTWGPSTGNRGWGIDELEEADSWQGITPVESWNLRLPGGIHIQAPRIITDAATEICRLAWLPDDDTLLRVEAGVTALQPMIVEEDMMIGFEPPALSSLRCDMMKKVGELEDALRPSRDWGKEDQQISRESEKIIISKSEDKSIKEETRGASNERNSNAKEIDQTNDQKPIRDSLSL